MRPFENPIFYLFRQFIWGVESAGFAIIGSLIWILMATVIWVALRAFLLDEQAFRWVRFARLAGLALAVFVAVQAELTGSFRWSAWTGLGFIPLVLLLTLPIRASIKRREEGVAIPMLIEAIIFALAIAPILSALRLIITRL